MYGKIHSDETKEKITASLRGKLHSEETKVKISLKNKGINNPMYGKTASDETRAKMRAAKLDIIGISVTIKDLETGLTSSYNSISKAALAINAPVTTFTRYLKSGKPYRDRYIITIHR